MSTAKVQYTFNFGINSSVRIVGTQVVGTVAAVYRRVGTEDGYLVRYVTPQGEPKEGWFDDNQLISA